MMSILSFNIFIIKMPPMMPFIANKFSKEEMKYVCLIVADSTPVADSTNCSLSAVLTMLVRDSGNITLWLYLYEPTLCKYCKKNPVLLFQREVGQRCGLYRILSATNDADWGGWHSWVHAMMMKILFFIEYMDCTCNLHSLGVQFNWID